MTTSYKLKENDDQELPHAVFSVERRPFWRPWFRTWRCANCRIVWLPLLEITIPRPWLPRAAYQRGRDIGAADAMRVKICVFDDAKDVLKRIHMIAENGILCDGGSECPSLVMIEQETRRFNANAVAAR